MMILANVNVGGHGPIAPPQPLDIPYDTILFWLVMFLLFIYITHKIISWSIKGTKGMFSWIGGMIGFSRQPKVRLNDSGLAQRRLFTLEERRYGMAACNYQCELIINGQRCSYQGDDLHGDHWYPYSRGGATTINNLVMLCPSCNMSKSNHLPSEDQTHNQGVLRHYQNSENQMPLTVGEWVSNSVRT